MTHPTQPTTPHPDPHAPAPRTIAGTLAPDEPRSVEAALASDPAAEADAAAWRSLRAAVAGQSVAAPPAAVLARVIEQVREREKVQVPEKVRVPEQASAIPSTRAWRWSWAWAGGALVALAVIALLWAAVRPGTELAWSAQGPVQAFRVYRAVAGTAEFSLVDEVRAQSGVTAYSYVDGRVWPGAYVYRVEAVGGEAAVSLAATETAADVGLAVLWERLAIVVIGMCMAYVVTALLTSGRPRRAMTTV